MNSDQKIMNHFKDMSAWEDRYKKIISLGKDLPLYSDANKTDEFLIKSCQSPLWLRAELGPENKVIFTGDSDGLITKGLLALMIEYCSNKTPEEILNLKFSFIEELNLQQYLSSKRTNGLQSLIDQIRNYAKAFYLLSHK